MGTKMAISFANIFMAKVETDWSNPQSELQDRQSPESKPKFFGWSAIHGSFQIRESALFIA